MGDISESVRDLYERQPHPAPLASLDDFISGRRLANLSPHHYFHFYWPHRRRKKDLDILVAGCGSSLAAVLAVQNPEARVVGVDLSDANLAATRTLVEKHGLQNLTLHRMPLERVSELGQEYDLVNCCGVLHHTPDPDVGLRALRSVLRTDGRMCIMVYAKYGRLGVYMMQDYARRLGIGLSPNEIGALRLVLQTMGPDHPLMPFARRYFDDMKRDFAVADTFLHPCDRAYTTSEVREWLARCDVKFCRWEKQAPYMPQYSPLAQTPHIERLLSLPETEREAAMELFWGNMTKHEFIACRNDTPDAAIQIDFHSPASRNFIPISRRGLGTNRKNLPIGISAEVFQNDPSAVLPPIRLNPGQENVLTLISQENLTIAQIAAKSGLQGETRDVERQVCDFVRQLYDYDIIFVKTCSE